MRRVEKDLKNIPTSLRTDSKSILQNPAKTTNERRLEVVSQGKYPETTDSSRYDARYRMPDIKKLLEAKYFGKCAYCETSVEQIVVEHYRPKRGGYYWLAYSWDNLLLACPKCNEYKGDKFPVSRTRVLYDSSRDTNERIHLLGTSYDKLEHPWVINPEKVSSKELNSIEFNKKGQISSKNARMRQTIEVCKLYRKRLCERRKKIWDDLSNEIKIAVYLSGNSEEFLRIRLSQVIESFVLKSRDETQDYTAFRKFIVKRSDWISDYVKELKGK